MDPVEVARLGVALTGLADDLGWSADQVRDRAWGLGPGESRGALAEVVGDFEHQRRELGQALARLGELARRAGGGYAVVEADVTGRLPGGGPGVGGGPW